MSALLALAVGHQLVRALSFAFGMFWEILWALILGFCLSGALQALVSKEEMRRRVTGAVAATTLRMLSPSCLDWNPSAFATPPSHTLHRDDSDLELVSYLLISEAIVGPEQDVRPLSLQARYPFSLHQLL